MTTSFMSLTILRSWSDTAGCTGTTRSRSSISSSSGSRHIEASPVEARQLGTPSQGLPFLQTRHDATRRLGRLLRDDVEDGPLKFPDHSQVDERAAYIMLEAELDRTSADSFTITSERAMRSTPGCLACVSAQFNW